MKKLNEQLKIAFFLNFKNGEKLRQLYLRKDVILLASVFEKIKKKNLIRNLVSILCIMYLLLDLRKNVYWNIIISDYKHFKIKI